MRLCPLCRRDGSLVDCLLPPVPCESSHFYGWMVELSSMGRSGFAVATSSLILFDMALSIRVTSLPVASATALWAVDLRRTMVSFCRFPGGTVPKWS